MSEQEEIVDLTFDSCGLSSLEKKPVEENVENQPKEKVEKHHKERSLRQVKNKKF